MSRLSLWHPDHARRFPERLVVYKSPFGGTWSVDRGVKEISKFPTFQQAIAAATALAYG